MDYQTDTMDPLSFNQTNMLFGDDDPIWPYAHRYHNKPFKLNIESHRRYHRAAISSVSFHQS